MSGVFKCFVICFCAVQGVWSWSDNRQRKFPPEFLFGVASSAYQVEGAWDADGKGESIWDRLAHSDPDSIADGSTGDTAADSYHLYQRDVQMLRELGVDYYRFSISWPRLFPTGFVNRPNQLGFEYYSNLIDELIKYNIEPMVTLYHWDLPQKIQDLGGWSNPLIIDWFEDFARVVFNRYSRRVKFWITFNQPNSICLDGYGDGGMAPRLQSDGIGDYVCVRNVLLAHARVWHLYNKEYRKKHKGKLGISLMVNWVDPISNATAQVKAAEEARQFYIGLYANPIFSKAGDFPKVVKDKIAKNSQTQGFPKSRLPSLTGEEIRLIKGSADFMGVNHYTTTLVFRNSSLSFTAPSFDGDVNVGMTSGDGWKQSRSSWLKSVPYGLYKASLWLNQQYDYPDIFLTENGWSSDPGLQDDDRVEFYRNYLHALLIAMEDGTRVMGYTAWSLMDNFEWRAGYSERFGLYEVDFESKEKVRRARKSALVYKEIIKSRVVNVEYEPKSLNIKASNRRLKHKVNEEL